MKEQNILIFTVALFMASFDLSQSQLVPLTEPQAVATAAGVAHLVQCGSIIETGGTDIPPQVFDCDYDCKTNHNASSGLCDPNTYNCICSGPKNTTNDCTYFNEYFHTNFICHCDYDSSTPIYGLIPYQLACEQDCACNHGARTGICDFEHHQCACDYDNFVYSNSTTNCQAQGFYNATKVFLDASKAIVDELNLNL